MLVAVGSTLEQRLSSVSGVCLLHATSTPAGRRLLASRGVRAGDVLFEERAVLWLTPDARGALQLAAGVASERRRRGGGRARAAIRAGDGGDDDDDAARWLAGAAGVGLGAGWSASTAVDEIASALSTAAAAAASASSPPLPRGSLRRLAAAVATNAVGCAFSASPLGSLSAVCLALSMSNHSCAPTAAWVSSWNGGEVVLRLVALLDVPPGGELTVCYVPLAAPAAARRVELSRRWAFTCECERCDATAGAGAGAGAGATRGDDTRVLRCGLCGGPARVGAAGCEGCGAPVGSRADDDGDGDDDAEGVPSLRAAAAAAGAAVRAAAAAAPADAALAATAAAAVDALHRDVLWWLAADDPPSRAALASARRLLHATDVALGDARARQRDAVLDAALVHPLGVPQRPPAPDELADADAAAADALSCVEAGARARWRRPEELVDALLARGEAAALAAAARGVGRGSGDDDDGRRHFLAAADAAAPLRALLGDAFVDEVAAVAALAGAGAGPLPAATLAERRAARAAAAAARDAELAANFAERAT